jgi:hypothetical protein
VNLNIPGCQTSPSGKDEPERFEVGATEAGDGVDVGSDSLENAGVHKSSPGCQTCDSAIGDSAAVGGGGGGGGGGGENEYGTTHNDGGCARGGMPGCTCSTRSSETSVAFPLTSLIRDADVPADEDDHGTTRDDDGGGGGGGDGGNGGDTVGPSPVQSLL